MAGKGVGRRQTVRRLWTSFIASAIIFLAGPAGASGLADAVVEQARSDCRAFDNGVLETATQAVSRVDLTGDGKVEEIVDSRHFTCPTALSLFCGTGGCEITVIAEDTLATFLAKDWKTVSWGDQTILLLAVHGSACGGTNLRKCFRAVVWSEGGFRSLEP